jgi:hypothetical protein
MLRFYFDHNMQRQIASGLRLRDVDVLTAYEDNAHTLSDLEILNRVSALSRVLVTKDIFWELHTRVWKVESILPVSFTFLAKTYPSVLY